MIEKKQIDLKPCPFCGAEVEAMTLSFGIVGVVDCKKCKTRFVIPWNEAETSNELAKAWNRRANNAND